jgi:hypothetical protein
MEGLAGFEVLVGDDAVFDVVEDIGSFTVSKPARRSNGEAIRSSSIAHRAKE